MSEPEATSPMSPTNGAPAHIPCIEVVELLTDYLEAHPESLIQGKSGGAKP